MSVSRPISPAAVELLGRVLNDLGLRPMRSGSITFNFSAAGKFESFDEHRHTRVVYETVAGVDRAVHTQSGT